MPGAGHTGGHQRRSGPRCGGVGERPYWVSQEETGGAGNLGPALT